MSTFKAVGKETKLREGLASVMGKSMKLPVQGTEVKTGDILGVLDTLIANHAATQAAKAAFHRAVAIEEAYRTQTRAFVSGVRAQLRAGLSDEELAACGLSRKRAVRTLSADERTAATAKLRATREAKGTRGVRQARQKEARAVITAAFAPPAPGEPDAPTATPANGTTPAR